MQVQKIVSLICAVCLLGTAPPLRSQQTCEKYGTIPVAKGEYSIQNNIWGAETRQCITATGGSGFRIDRVEHTYEAGRLPAAYPFIWKGCHWTSCTKNSGLPIKVRAAERAFFSWNFTLVKTGVWNAVAEIWFKKNYIPGPPDGTELMLWFDSKGVAPAGYIVDVILLADALWEVWFAQLDWKLVTYRRRIPVSSVELDLLPFIQDSIDRGYIDPEWYLMGLEAGFELWQGGEGLQTNTFAVQFAENHLSANAGD